MDGLEFLDSRHERSLPRGLPLMTLFLLAVTCATGSGLIILVFENQEQLSVNARLIRERDELSSRQKELERAIARLADELGREHPVVQSTTARLAELAPLQNAAPTKSERRSNRSLMSE